MKNGDDRFGSKNQEKFYNYRNKLSISKLILGHSARFFVFIFVI